MPASTLSSPASCPPTAPMATAKVTDDLLIARSDRHLGVLIAVAFSVAFEEADPARRPTRPLPWLLLAPGSCSSLTCCAPIPLCLGRFCSLRPLWGSLGSRCMLSWDASSHGFLCPPESPWDRLWAPKCPALPTLPLARRAGPPGSQTPGQLPSGAGSICSISSILQLSKLRFCEFKYLPKAA